jgi:hypothetical protein
MSNPVRRADRVAADGGELGEADVPQLGRSHAEIAETEGAVRIVGIDFAQQPGALRVGGGEEFDDGRRVLPANFTGRDAVLAIGAGRQIRGARYIGTHRPKGATFDWWDGSQMPGRRGRIKSSSNWGRSRIGRSGCRGGDRFASCCSQWVWALPSWSFCGW